MIDELVDIQGKLIPANKIKIPDIRFIGVFLDKNPQVVLNFAYNAALEIRRKILLRKNVFLREEFEIYIPALMKFVEPLRDDIKEEVKKFLIVFQGLVRHIISEELKVTGYTYDDKTKHGVSYKGFGWI